nr:solute carrier family 25 member 48-like [Aotus nancymaae]
MRGNCQRAGLAPVPGNVQSLTLCHLLSPVFAANLSLKSRAVALGEQPVYQGPVHCIATIVRNEGLAGLYRGASAMLLRDVPGYCLYFIPYVFLSEWITPEACAGPSPCAVWLAGGVAEFT